MGDMARAMAEDEMAESQKARRRSDARRAADGVFDGRDGFGRRVIGVVGSDGTVILSRIGSDGVEQSMSVSGEDTRRLAWWLAHHCTGRDEVSATGAPSNTRVGWTGTKPNEKQEENDER